MFAVRIKYNILLYFKSLRQLPVPFFAFVQVACMQFVNIIVHSVEDMNFRVHLQYEFTALKLDDYLERLRFCESEDLQVHCTMFTGLN